MCLVVVVGHHWPLLSNLGRPRDGPALPHLTDVRCLQSALPEPQPTTVSHDGGHADRPGARVPRCTPTALPAPSTRASYDGQHVLTVFEPSPWEAQVI